MPCDRVAVQTARLAVNVVRELTGSATGREALRRLIAAGLGLIAERVSVFQYAPETIFKCYDRDVAVILNGQTGELHYRGSRYRQAELEQLKAALEPALPVLAQMVAQNRLAEAVKANATAVLADTVDHSGTRRMKIRLVAGRVS